MFEDDWKQKAYESRKAVFLKCFSTVWGVRFNARVGWDHRDLGYQVDYKTWIRQHPTTFWRFCIRGLDSKLWASAASCTLVASTCWSQWLWTPATRTIATSRGDNFAGACLWQRRRNIPQLSHFPSCTRTCHGWGVNVRKCVKEQLLGSAYALIKKETSFFLWTRALQWQLRNAHRTENLFHIHMMGNYLCKTSFHW